VKKRPDEAPGEPNASAPGARPQDDAWLARPSTIRLLWRVFTVMLVLVVAAQLVFPVKGKFGVDGWLGFGAVFGFLSCLAMVLFAKALGSVLKRDENYYGESDD
jgi:hypothetical protein